MKRILIIEDHADIRRLVRMTLEFEDYEVHEAVNGPMGVAAAAELRPDVILLDVMMPGAFNGLEACRLLRADPNLQQAAIVMLSARGQSQDREAGLAAGADAYLVKPFSPLNLIDTIESLAAAA